MGRDMKSEQYQSSPKRVLHQQTPEQTTPHLAVKLKKLWRALKTSVRRRVRGDNVQIAGQDRKRHGMTGVLGATYAYMENEELVEIIYTKLKDAQVRNQVTTDYFLHQPYISVKMRSILVNWIGAAHTRLNLQEQTLFLCVNYIDRYLEHVEISIPELPLVGLTCLFIAVKYEEAKPIHLVDVVAVSDKMYDCSQIIAKEREILGVLGFQLTATTSHDFYEYFSHRLPVNNEENHLALFILQKALLHLPLKVCYAPTMQAASALLLARCIAMGRFPGEEWVRRWETCVACSVEDLYPCLEDMSAIIAYHSKK